MPIENNVFLGAEDLDSPYTNIPRGFHRTARNGVFRGPQGNMRLESVPGTIEIPNPFLPNTGTNKTINSSYDAVYKRIFVFNYNSSGNHAIYIFNTQPQTWQSLLAVGSGTDGDILGFLPQAITSVSINYRESVDGNLLFFVDSLGRPTCFNIDRYLNNPYPVAKRAFIDLAKAPTIMPPQVTYENDPTATVNNLKNALFQFRTRPIYDDFQKPVLGTGSIVPLPPDYGLPFANDPTKNSIISVYVSTGDIDVKKIEIWGTQYSDAVAPAAPGSNLNVLGNYFLVATLDKAELNIPSNDVYRFVFRNDGVYPPGDPVETNLLFDWVPQTTNTLELLNGDVPILGGVTEGYDPVALQMSANAFSGITPPYSAVPGVLFFAAADGQNSGGTGTTLTVILTGSGPGSPYPTGFPFMNGTWAVSANDLPVGTDISFSFTGGGNVVNSLLLSIEAAAVSAGWTAVSIVNNVLTLSYPAGFILNSSSVVKTSPFFGDDDIAFAFPDSSAEQFALQYFDDKGRTNGATLSANGVTKTKFDDSGNTINYIQISIASRPPIWAKYYDIVRAAALTYNKRLFWVSNQTFVNVDLNTNIRYAYIGISYMTDYDRNIEAATNVVSYEFSPGDRVQFQAKYLYDKTESVYSTPFDFEIVSTETNPVANGVVNQGTFLKIVYPASQIVPGSFDFGGDNYQWYKILIYSYVKHFENPSTQVFYEFSKRFGIGNPGTPNAYHLGLSQSQAPNLVTPALIDFTDGDLFYRKRNVPVGIINNPITGTMSFSDRYASVPVAIEGGNIINTRYELLDTILISSNTDTYNYASTNYLFWNKQATAVTIRVQGEYQASVDDAITHNLFFKNVSLSGAIKYNYVVRNYPMPLTANQNKSYDIVFDAYIEVPATTKVFFQAVNQSISGVSHLNINSFTYFRFTIQDNILIPIIESSYSDKYNIVCNSNSRPTVFDPNAKQQYFPTLMRWGLADQLNTNINQSNRFYYQNADEIDKSHGDIRRLKARQRELRIYQDRRTGRTGIYSRFLKQNDGTDVVATTNEIISKNNVEYYDGDFGMGNQPASLASSGFVDYFTDPVRGSVIRISQNGATEISRLYKVQTWAGSVLPKYLKNYPYQYGGNAQILGVCYFVSDRDSEIIFVTQGSGSTLAAESHSFDETRNAWTSFYDFAPDSIVCAENQLFSFSNGIMYQHNNQASYCNFYGNQFKPSITIVKNDATLLKKRWISLSQIANAPWAAPDIFTEEVNYGQTQQSNLIESDFDFLEGQYSAHFLNDVNSPGGIADGDFLNGSYMVARLEPANGAIFNYLALAAVKYNRSTIVEA